MPTASNDLNKQLPKEGRRQKVRLQEGKARRRGGRRQETPNLDLFLRDEVQNLVIVEDEGKKKRLTAAELIVRSLVNKAAAGDMKSILFIYREQPLFPTLSVRIKLDFSKMSSEQVALEYMRMVREG